MIDILIQWRFRKTSEWIGIYRFPGKFTGLFRFYKKFNFPVFPGFSRLSKITVKWADLNVRCPGRSVITVKFREMGGSKCPLFRKTGNYREIP